MTDADRSATLALPAGWEEARYDEGAFGPDGRAGLDAAFERGAATLAVVPVRYRREGGRERVAGLTREVDMARRDLGGIDRDVDPRTAFAAHAAYELRGAHEEDVLCVAHEAGDALAVAVWLARAAADATDLQAHVRHHAGAVPGQSHVLDDDTALSVTFRTEPDTCIFTGTPTTSHRIEIPYRYAALFENAPESARGVVRFPSTVETLVGAVSHRAWTERELSRDTFRKPVERAGAGEYRLDGRAADLATEVDAEALGLRRLGE